MTQQNVPVRFATGISSELQEKVLKAPQFSNWLEKTRLNFDLRSVLVRDVLMFGTRVGFVVVEADAWNEGAKMPCFAMLRDPTISIMPVVTIKDAVDEKYVVLVREARLPVGQMVTALPAGVIDGEAVEIAALRELREETGLNLTAGKPYRLRDTPVFLSPGGSSEEMILYAVDIVLTRAELDGLFNRKAGLADEHEHTTVCVVPLEDMPRHTPNAHCLLSWHLYQQHCADLKSAQCVRG
ncbi:NUDIX domain-containing protein [Gluconobacter sp. Dm-62]|uniref:NUDIX domain-containing protein n=1 Tax=Gluconobacter sp. Dm-62 TaxID=2799804 RepID=UPI001B8CCFDD|nr:NUDIX domain-containing protein [Gluconobacter sp. Dm-62]MBS1102895.1 NUDIX domain-containing protein [Gluconobacter sp. Dm-62]